MLYVFIVDILLLLLIIRVWLLSRPPTYRIVICETCVVFYFLPRAPSKLLANLQNKNQSCKIDPTAPPVLHM